MKNILVVDDEPHVCRISKMTLTREGYNVKTANNGAAGLDEIRKSMPDFMIVDIDMPIMNGFEMCRAFLHEFPHSESQIFISTSRTEDEFRDLASGNNNIHFIEKPMSFRNLLKKISAIDTNQ